jgi:plasmid maintenance system killer protein
MLRAMDIEFADARLALIETEAAAETCLPVAVIQIARQRLSIMRAAPDTRTLQNWKSLGLKSAVAPAEYFVMLSPQWAMAVKITEKNSIMTVVVTAMEQQLRGAA